MTAIGCPEDAILWHEAKILCQEDGLHCSMNKVRRQEAADRRRETSIVSQEKTIVSSLAPILHPAGERHFVKDSIEVPQPHPVRCMAANER